MEDYNSHGIDCIESFITHKEIPPVRYLEMIQIEVQNIAKRHRLEYARAMEYLVRSMINCCAGKFKKDVRLWMHKRYQSKRPSIELTDYEKQLALAIHESRETVLLNSDLNRCHNNTYGHIQKPTIPRESSPMRPPPPDIDMVTSDYQCPTHKKDCRLWLHKTSDQVRKKAVNGRTCQWYKDNVTLTRKLSQGHTTVPDVRVEEVEEIQTCRPEDSIAAGDFECIERTKEDRQNHHYSHVTFQKNDRYSLHNGWHSDSSSDSDVPNGRRRHSPRRNVCRTNNFTNTCDIVYSEGSDPDIDPSLQPPQKVCKRGVEIGNTEDSKTVSDVRFAGPTPSSSSVCTQVSAHYHDDNKPGTVDGAHVSEALARQMLEAQVTGERPHSQSDVRRSHTYVPMYRSHSLDNTFGLVCEHEGMTTVIPGDNDLNSNLYRGRTSSQSSMNGNTSD